MRIFERRALIGLAMVTSLVAMWSCGSATTCLRYSDCDQGLTCANGLCVIAGGDGDGGDGGGDDDGGSTTTPTPTSTATTSPTPAADAGSETVDAMTADAATNDAAADAAIADASTD